MVRLSGRVSPRLGRARDCRLLGLVAAVDGWLAWPLVGLVAASTYLLVIAGQFTIADSRG